MSFVHQKGGVGKTSICAAAARLLAGRGVRVLAIDADPQGSLTDLMACVPASAGLAELVVDSRFDLARMVALPQLVPAWGFEVIPAGGALALVESVRPVGIETFLFRAVGLLADGFDVVLIDTPGTLAELSTAAIAAADVVVVPTLCEQLALAPIGATLAHVAAVGDAYSRSIDTLHVVNSFDQRLADHRHGLESIRASLGEPAAIIPRRTAMADAASMGVPLDQIRTGGSARVRAAVDQLVDQVLARLDAATSTVEVSA